MTPSNNNTDRRCAAIQTQLTDYMDNRLSARQMWAVEKHLAECAECARMTHEITTTVQFLQAMERRDTGDDFMAKLHARLDSVEPERTRRRSFSDACRDWLAGVQDALRGYRGPALGLSVGMVGLLTLFLIPRMTPNDPAITAPATTLSAAEPVNRNVALSASNPFEDPAAANLQTLQANYNGSEDNDNTTD